MLKKYLKSDQKIEMIRLYRLGYMNSTIASRLNINPNTVASFLYKYSKIKEEENKGKFKRFYDHTLTEDELLNPSYLKLKYDDVKGEIPTTEKDELTGLTKLLRRIR